MLKLDIHPFELPFKHKFTISRHSKTTQPLVVVSLDKGGQLGLGEATANSYYQMTASRLVEDLEGVRPLLNKIDLNHPEELWDQLAGPLSHNFFALCAIDMAAWDLYAKMKGKKLYELWGLNIENNPLTDYTIGIGSIKEMLSKMKEFPWPIYKIKLGTADDINIIKALRKETSALFRIDANCGWDLQQTIDNSKVLKKLGVEFLEQPMPDPGNNKEGWARLRKAYRESELPIIADENCIREEDVEKCHGYFHGINIKLVKCGGLTPALRMIKEAKGRNMKLMVGSMNESVVGSSAAAHLAPYLDYIDLDGPLLLQAEDMARGISFEDGKIIYADRPGTGVERI